MFAIKSSVGGVIHDHTGAVIAFTTQEYAEEYLRKLNQGVPYLSSGRAVIAIPECFKGRIVVV